MGAAKITLFGMIRWQEGKGKDLFGKLTLPDGVDKELFTGNLMLTAGEFGVLYADGDFMTGMIGIWGRKHYRTFNKWIRALNTEYEPLYNLDVYEESTDTGTTAGSRTETGRNSATDSVTGGYNRTDGFNRTETLAEDITDTNDLTSTTEGSNVTENTRSAFDSSAYQPHDRQAVTADSETTDTGDVVRDRDQQTSTVNSGTQTDTHNETRTVSETVNNGEETSGSTRDVHSSHRYGNQGITMSQQMLQSELDVQRWNIYEHMTDLFVQEFCIPVYI